MWAALNLTNLELYMHLNDTKNAENDPTAARSPAKLIGNPHITGTPWVSSMSVIPWVSSIAPYHRNPLGNLHITVTPCVTSNIPVTPWVSSWLTRVCVRPV